MAAGTPWWRGSRGEWYVVVQALLFALIGFGPRTFPGAPPWPQPWGWMATVLGVVLMLAGGALSAGGLLALGSANLTALPYPKDSAELRETGPYAIVRHPVYSGLIFGAFGWALFRHAPLTLLFSVALFVLFDLKSRREERWLLERFPQYAEYCARVRKLLPWVY